MSLFPEKSNVFTISLYSVLGAMLLYIILLILSFLSYLTPQDIRETLGSGEIIAAIKLTLLTATISSFIALLIAIPCAFILSRYRFKSLALIDTILDIPIVLSPVALGTAILFFFQSGPGRWIEDNTVPVIFSFAGIVLAQFTVVSALAIRLVKATFDEINPRYGQVARVLGCSKARAFFKVELPLAKRGIIAAALITWARAMGEFGATVTVAGATAFKTETLATGIYLHLSSVQLEKTAVLMTIMVVLAFCVLFLTRLVAKKREAL